MKAVEYGTENREVAVLLHGGGLSWWSCREAALRLSERFHVVIPILDGHGGSDAPFVSIERCAGEILAYLDQTCGGHVRLISGLSLGGQVLVEMLSQRRGICDAAFIESALCLPMRLTAALIGPAFSLCYPLIARRWFSRLQFQSLGIRRELFEEYYADTVRISRSDMTAFLAANADYRLRDALAQCGVKATVAVGGREKGIMRRSAEKLARAIPGAELTVLPGLRHGELSINRTDDYVKRLLEMLA